MRIRLGYDMTYHCSQPTPVIATLHVHSSRSADLESPDYAYTDPELPLTGYTDMFGNWVTRLVLPEGENRLFTNALIEDCGQLDNIAPQASQFAVENLHENVLVYLLGSRYCETDVLIGEAWRLFSTAPFGWQRVQAVCEFVYQHLTFGYEFARSTKTAAEAYREKVGVCRDFTHLAITLCRCLNIPARYCTGYISDLYGEEPDGEMDFAAWFEAYLEGGWYVFDPRNNQHKAGRILMARGRDAADVAIVNSFGNSELRKFSVTAEEIKSPKG